MRIGINIPKELHQRIQPLKGTMNISEICREAIEARVKKHEEFAGWLDSESAEQAVAEICEKELQRKAMVEVDWETIGYQDAVAWVQAATLADWDYWNRCRNHPHRFKSECDLDTRTARARRHEEREIRISRRSKNILSEAP